MKEKKCKNCSLFDAKLSHCKVIILVNGERINIPTEPNDDCFFLQEFIGINENGKKEKFEVSADVVKIWAENEKGEKIDGFKESGKIKMQIPEGFFPDEKPK